MFIIKEWPAVKDVPPKLEPSSAAPLLAPEARRPSPWWLRGLAPTVRLREKTAPSGVESIPSSSSRALEPATDLAEDAWPREAESALTGRPDRRWKSIRTSLRRPARGSARRPRPRAPGWREKRGKWGGAGRVSAVAQH
jgi:hypothetical protein